MSASESVIMRHVRLQPEASQRICWICTPNPTSDLNLVIKGAKPVNRLAQLSVSLAVPLDTPPPWEGPDEQDHLPVPKAKPKSKIFTSLLASRHGRRWTQKITLTSRPCC